MQFFVGKQKIKTTKMKSKTFQNTIIYITIILKPKILQKSQSNVKNPPPLLIKMNMKPLKFICICKKRWKILQNNDISCENMDML